MTINLSVANIFGYASDIVNSLLPVVYVSAGIALGFVVVMGKVAEWGIEHKVLSWGDPGSIVIAPGSLGYQGLYTVSTP